MKIEEKVVDIGTDENGQTYTIKEIKAKNNIFKRAWNWIKSDDGQATIILGTVGLMGAVIGALFGETVQIKKDALPKGFNYKFLWQNAGGDQKELDRWLDRNGFNGPVKTYIFEDEKDKPEN